MGTEVGALTTLLSPSVEGLGYELLGVEFVPGSGGSVLRVYIDAKDGVDVDDCAAVSHQVSGVLDVEDPIPGEYALEVSSPGLDRPLFTVAHFERFTGMDAKVVLSEDGHGRRQLKGTIESVCGGDVVALMVDGERVEMALGSVVRANLVPDV